MTKPLAKFDGASLTGDLERLAAQLGPADSMPLGVALASLGECRVDSAAALRDFLAAYRDQILAPVEFPAILRAHAHALHGQTRELLQLDRELAREPRLEKFAAASRGVGRRQLHRLRPLRDQRVVQRYLAAVDDGRAHGWHTLVFGLTLAVYSLPLRQGLQHYAQQTLGGFVSAAAARLALSSEEANALTEEIISSLPALVSQAVNDDNRSGVALPGRARVLISSARPE